MKTSFTVGLLMAVSAQAKVERFNLTNNWLVDFDVETCDLKIHKHIESRESSRVTVFEADKNMLQTGKGDVDDIEIMDAGNIQNVPKKLSTSQGMQCSQSSVNSSADTFSFNGQIMIKEADGDNEALTSDFTINLQSSDENRLSFSATASDTHSDDKGTNFFSMSYSSDWDEEIYGMGL